AKSALSDARGALATYLANTSSNDEGVTVKDGTFFIVEKAKKIHEFKFVDGQITVFKAPYNAAYTGDVLDTPTAPDDVVVVDGADTHTTSWAIDADTAHRALIPDSVFIFVPTTVTTPTP
ncbi:MAG: hypothetical protein GX802_03030, partial [Clostridiales bacterium]|nr:hypothetical protein [Clostridiales bacterium]